MSERIKCPCGATNPPGEDCTGLFHDSWAYVERLRTLRRLARNLRDAACCAIAYDEGRVSGICEVDGEMEGTAWTAGCGETAPGWSR